VYFRAVRPPELEVRLESPLPELLPAGQPTALFCLGTACQGKRSVTALELSAGAAFARASGLAMPRPGMTCLRSSFWAVVPVPATAPGQVELRARIRLSEGQVEERTLGSIAIVDAASPSGGPKPGSGQELIAVCMATFDPDPELLDRQLASLRAQTDTGWICVISDDCSARDRFHALREAVGSDERFLITRSEERIGFYRNFERALEQVPPEASLIALCDQDDRWHPEKLSVLRRSLGPATLVYSDQRLVRADGEILRPTLWQGRANNHTSLASMLVANTVTGAAALFRREVAERALPFPDAPGIEFHDHWLALVALACGELRYVDRPLYDYVQHSAAVLGQVVETSRRAKPAERLRHRQSWRAAYFFGYAQGQVRARALLLRCADRLSTDKRRDLERYLAADSSLGVFLWLWMRPLRGLSGRTETLGGEWELARGIVWFALARFLARRRWLPRRLLLDASFPDATSFRFRRLQRWRSRM
jgi:glycosyltransferase involved in cell wall biosynthesis